MCLSLWVCSFLYFVHRSVFLHVLENLGVRYCLSMYLSVFRSVCLSDCLPGFKCIRLFVFESLWISVSLSLFVGLHRSETVCLSA